MLFFRYTSQHSHQRLAQIYTTKSAEVLAFAAIAAMLPQSVLGLFTGIFIDRWKRKRVMILADSFIAFCTLILAVLFYLDIAKIEHIYIMLALRSVGSAFHMPAMQASVPLLAPKSELIRIAGINQIIQSACNIAGPTDCGSMAAMAAKASTSADFVSKLSHRMIAKLTIELVRIEKN